MKLLICTQRVDKDDPALGFFHDWILEFSKHFEQITIVCLYEGVHNLPQKVKVLSLGKEKGESRLKYISNFYTYIWRERKNYDVVFVHMNQIYVVLGGLLWRMWHKKIGLWYVHRATSLSLRIATLFTNEIFTASEKSFNLKTPKLHIIGHGVNVDLFKKMENPAHDKFSIISVGRITRIKNIENLIDAASMLKEQGLDFSYEIVGPRVTADDHVYFEELQNRIKDNELSAQFHFSDGVPLTKLPHYFWKSDLNINLTPTGGIDKVVLEGIIAGVLPLVSNRAFVPIFGPYADQLTFELKNSIQLAEKIRTMYKMKERNAMLKNLYKKVEIDFSLPRVVETIVTTMIE